MKQTCFLTPRFLPAIAQSEEETLMKTKKPRNVNVTPDRRLGNGLIIVPRHSPSRPELNLLWLALSSHRQVRNKLSSHPSGKRSRSKTGRSGQTRQGHRKAPEGRAAPRAGRAGLPTSPGRHRLPRRGAPAAARRLLTHGGSRAAAAARRLP